MKIDTTTRPDVTVVVIALNELDHGPGCVRAIMAQETVARFELIFVDDGSTDGTAEAVAESAAGDKRFRLIRFPENRGRGAARAAGVEAARGRAIAFVDADITLPPDWLARCLAELPGHAAVGGTPVPDGDAAVLARVSGATPRVRTGLMPVTGGNVLYDAAVFESVGFDPRDRLGEDTRLASRLIRSGHELLRIPGLIVRHEERKSYWQGLRWRFENGVDASSLPRELGVLRLVDVVWIGWLGSWVVGLVGAAVGSPWLLLLGPAAAAGVGVVHAVSRFQLRPIVPFMVACLAAIPYAAAYLLGRTAGIPRLLGRGR